MFRRCEDEKMFYRPPLLEEPCAQTLSGKNVETLWLPWENDLQMVGLPDLVVGIQEASPTK